MLRTRICALLGIEHPIVLGGMGNATSPELVAAVSTAGGLGVLGATRQNPEELARDAAAIRVRFAQADGIYGETAPRIDRATGLSPADVAALRSLYEG